MSFRVESDRKRHLTPIGTNGTTKGTTNSKSAEAAIGPFHKGFKILKQSMVKAKYQGTLDRVWFLVRDMPMVIVGSHMPVHRVFSAAAFPTNEDSVVFLKSLGKLPSAIADKYEPVWFRSGEKPSTVALDDEDAWEMLAAHLRYEENIGLERKPIEVVVDFVKIVA